MSILLGAVAQSCPTIVSSLILIDEEITEIEIGIIARFNLSAVFGGIPAVVQSYRLLRRRQRQCRLLVEGPLVF